jgi:hypothetical protein
LLAMLALATLFVKSIVEWKSRQHAAELELAGSRETATPSAGAKAA